MSAVQAVRNDSLVEKSVAGRAKLRVSLFANSAWYLYNFRQNLIQDLLASGHDVTVVAPYDDFAPRLEALGAEFVPLVMQPLSVNPLSELGAFVRLYRAFRRVKPDIVLSFTIKGNLYAGLCRALLGFRQVANISGLGQVFERDGLVNSLVRVLYRYSLAGAERVFFQNNEDMEFCVSKRLVPASKSIRIPGSGVDLSRFRPMGFGVRSQKRTFLMFGRLVQSKGYNELLEAAAELKKRHGDRIEFAVMGMVDKNRPESQELLSRIEQAHVAGLVRHLSPTDNVVPVLQSATAVVLPSWYNEGVPRSLLEALGCGKPIITTDWKGCRETVVPGKNGYLIPTQSAGALIDAIERLFQLPAAELDRMGAESRALAESSFDEKRVIAAYLTEISS